MVELGAEAEQLASLLQDELAAERDAGPLGEEGRDVPGALKVRGEGGLEDGQLRAAGEARRKGNLGERRVEKVAVLVLLAGSQHDDVALERARLAAVVSGELEVLDFAQRFSVGLFGGPQNLLRHDVGGQRPRHDGARGEDEDVAAIDAPRMDNLCGVEAGAVGVDCEAVRRENLQHHGHVEGLGDASRADHVGRIGFGFCGVDAAGAALTAPLRLLGDDGDSAQRVFGRRGPGGLPLGYGRGIGRAGLVLMITALALALTLVRVRLRIVAAGLRGEVWVRREKVAPPGQAGGRGEVEGPATARCRDEAVNLAGSDIDADSQRRSPHGGGGLLAMEGSPRVLCFWLMTPRCRDQFKQDKRVLSRRGGTFEDLLSPCDKSHAKAEFHSTSYMYKLLPGCCLCGLPALARFGTPP